MKCKWIQNCTLFYGYGNIDNRIAAKRYEWEETDDILLRDIAKIMKDECPFPYLYLFTSRKCFYPVGKIDAYFGLWKHIEKKYKFEVKRQEEQKYVFDRFIAFCGIAQFRLSQMDIAAQLLQMDFRNSFMFFSDRDDNLFSDFQSALEITPKSYCVNFSKVISSHSGCGKIVTFIDGSGGSSLNFFQFE